VFLSRPGCPQQITAICAYRDRVLVAWGGGRSKRRGLWVFKRGRILGELEVLDNSVSQEIEQITVFGQWIVGCGPQAVEVWKTESYEHYTTILPTSRPVSDPGSRIFSGPVCTLPTFLNKIFVGRQDGNVEVYNVSTARLVHTILAPSASSGRVTALSPVPSLCLLTIAYADGSLVIHDVETDDHVIRLQQNSRYPITSISFRTDGAGAGEDGGKDGLMATASTESGDITLWDLNRGGKVVGVVRGAHETSSVSRGTGITKIEFLPGQPVLVSSGLDNALRSWIFDQDPFSPIPRPLHSRSGHAAPVTTLQFLPSASDGSDAAGKWLLSAGQDRSLWGFSIRKDGQSTELSQGHVKHKAKKLGHLGDDLSSVEDFKAPPIIDMACSLNRDGGMGAVSGPVWTNTRNSNAEEASMTGWESVVTAHSDDRYARTWSWGRKKAGRWAFETGDRKPVTSVAMTACGTFALVGSAGGSLDMFNLQSGIHRQRYPPRPSPSKMKLLKSQASPSDQSFDMPHGHRDAITGVVVDNLNQTMVSSSLDGSIIFWKFSSGRILHRMSYEETAATGIRYNPVSGLLALACDDLCIRVVDIETRKTVRELWGCAGQIYDYCFSHDGRWIVACSMDSVVRVYDLATGHLIDAFKTTTCTNVAFSSTGEFLATSHAGSLGVSIWHNKALFTHVPTQQIDEIRDVIDLSDMSAVQSASQVLVDNTGEADGEILEQTDLQHDIDQLDASLLTLSLVPRSRWQTLLNLESIRARNKPIQPLEKPKAAPFFLGARLINGNRLADAQADGADQSALKEDERSRIARLAVKENAESRMSKALDKFWRDGQNNASELTSHLASLPPSATDLEIRSLTLREMPIFVHALTAQLRLRTYFELVNTWMSVFLSVHGDFVTEVEALNDAVLEWRAAMEHEQKRLSDLVGYTKGVIDFLRSAR